MDPFFQRRSPSALCILLLGSFLFQLSVTAVYGLPQNIESQLLIDIYGKPPPVTSDNTVEVTTANKESRTIDPQLFVNVFDIPSPTTSMVETNEPVRSSSRCDGVCVNHFLCKNNTINTDGTGIIDIRLKPGNPCPSYYDTCCEQSMLKSENQTLSSIDKRVKCGHRNSDGVGFKITGNINNEAEFGEFPWMVAILKIVNQEKPDYVCGGSLIHPRVVLTATHCINKQNPDELVVRAGEWDSKIENEVLPHQDIKVSRIVKRENYNSGALYNDISLIFLVDSFVLRDNIGTVCLPAQDFEFINERCYASGWGKQVFGQNGVYQNILKKVNLPIVQYETCMDKLTKSKLGSKFVLHESFICAGGEIGQDTCKGDGGSPLMCPTPENPNQYHQAGIVSWGIGCGTDVPGVYTKVAHYRNWIDEMLQAENLDTSYYDAYYNLPPV